jgi:hypothetical protein
MNGSQRFWANDGQVLPNPVKEELPTILKVDGDKRVYRYSSNGRLITSELRVNQEQSAAGGLSKCVERAR